MTLRKSPAMLLYANGCSMTLGLELERPRQDAYPSILARHFEAELFNHSFSGSSNCRILRTSLLWLTNYLNTGGDPSQLFVLIGWTAPTRREVALAEEEGSEDPTFFWRDIFVHCSLRDAPTDLTRLHKLVFEAFACDRESMSRFLVAATSLQGLLVRYGIRYCFTHCMPIGDIHPELAPLTTTIDKRRFFRFLDANGDFLSRAHAWETPTGPLCHPLTEGHQRWSAELIDHIEKGQLL